MFEKYSSVVLLFSTFISLSTGTRSVFEVALFLVLAVYGLARSDLVLDLRLFILVVIFS